MSCRRPERGAHAPSPAPESRRGGEPAPEREPPAAPVCDLCGAAMLESHCKLICPACGYTRDCSDP